MKFTTFCSIWIGLFLLGAPLAFAEGGQGLSADTIVSKMQTKLNLTPEQATAVKPIVEETMAKRQEIRGAGGDKREMFKQMKQLKEEEEKKLSGVLTPEQMKQWTDAKSEMRQKFMERKRSGGGGMGAVE